MRQTFYSFLVILSSIGSASLIKVPYKYAPYYGYDHQLPKYQWNLPIDYGLYSSASWPNVNALLDNSFDRNIVHLPASLPNEIYAKPLAFVKPHITSYEVREEVFDTEPPATLFPPPRTTIALGSGSLGIVHLGNGNFALGSGSLGYASAIVQQPYQQRRRQQQQKQQQVKVQPEEQQPELQQLELQQPAPVRGGLHQVPAPQLFIPTTQQAVKDFVPKAFPTTTPYLDFNSLQQHIPQHLAYSYIKV